MRLSKAQLVGLFVAISLVTISLAGMGRASAQPYPNRPIRLIVPYAPGSTTDILARILSESVSKSIGQQIIVDPRPGANGIIGASVVAKAAPDGYTLMIGAGLIHAALPYLSKNVPFDPVKSFTFITLLTETSQSLVVSSKLPVNSLAELLALAKAKPRSISYATSNAASKMFMQYLMIRAGVEFLEVPYANAVQAANDVGSGQVNVTSNGRGVMRAFLDNGLLRPIATAALVRDPKYPETPTVAETFSGFNVLGWLGLVGPGGLPKDIVDLLNSKFRGAMEDPAFRQSLEANDLNGKTSTPEQFVEYIERDAKTWGEVAKAGQWVPQ